LGLTTTPRIRRLVLGPLLALPLAAGAQPAAGPPSGEAVRLTFDAGAIRAALETYRQALEAKDLELLRQIRPGLSAGEIERFTQAFDQIDSLQVTLTVHSIAASDEAAVVKGLREDRFVLKDGSTLNNEAPFVYTLKETAEGWVLVSTR
jgi:hypothetical protein